MKCTVCNQECFLDSYPEVVFTDDTHCICEECSVDFEEIDGYIFERDGFYIVNVKSEGYNYEYSNIIHATEHYNLEESAELIKYGSDGEYTILRSK